MNRNDLQRLTKEELIDLAPPFATSSDWKRARARIEGVNACRWDFC